MKKIMKRQHIYLPEPLIEKLDELSEKKGIPKAELIRRAIDEFIKKEAEE